MKLYHARVYNIYNQFPCLKEKKLSIISLEFINLTYYQISLITY